jgi:hypothetical protein
MAAAVFAETLDDCEYSTLPIAESRSYTLSGSRENFRTRITGRHFISKDLAALNYE